MFAAKPTCTGTSSSRITEAGLEEEPHFEVIRLYEIISLLYETCVVTCCTVARSHIADSLTWRSFLPARAGRDG